MLLFRGEEHIDLWCAQWSQPRGAILRLDQAWQLASAWHRTRLDEDWRRFTLEEIETIFGQLGLTGPFWNLRP